MDEQLRAAALAVEEEHWWYRGRRRIIAAEIERLALPPAPRILDAGCGSGRMLVELARYGAVAGVELDSEAVAIARARDHFDVRIARVEELPFPDASFDLITCLDVIEHTPDDCRTLSELRRVCRPGGWLLVTVPAYPALWSRHDEQNHHYRRYTRAMLRASSLAAGWRPIRTTSFNCLLLAPAAAVRLAQRWLLPSSRRARGTDLELGPAWLNGLLERPLAVEAAWLRRGRSLPFGLSLLSVLRRPAA
jgi:SAM-dependent methyltransferase